MKTTKRARPGTNRYETWHARESSPGAEQAIAPDTPDISPDRSFKPMRRYLWALGIVASLLLLNSFSAAAQFTGDFHLFSWWMSPPMNGSGSMSLLDSGQTLTMESEFVDAHTDTTGASIADFSTTISDAYTEGQISFHWEFTAETIERLTYQVNGAETELATASSSGDLSVQLKPGDTFKLRIYLGKKGTIKLSSFVSLPENPATVPQFQLGTTTSLRVVQDAGATAIDDLLTATDASGTQALYWLVSANPANGTLGGFHTLFSGSTSGNFPLQLLSDWTNDLFYEGFCSGSIGTPAGLTYTPAAGYSGPDSFTIEVSDGVASSTITVDVTVIPRQIVTFDPITPKTYGDAPFTLAATADTGNPVTLTSSDPTVVSVSGTSATILKAGTVTITATCEGDDQHGAAVPVSHTVVIAPKELTVQNAVAANKFYDGTTGATITGATLDGIVGSDDVTLANAETGTFAQATTGLNIDVATAMTLSGADAGNYTLTTSTLLANISALPITVTADGSQTKVYGEADPTLTYSVFPALIGGDGMTGNLERTPGEAAGTYTINQGTLDAGSNYTIIFVRADFTVTPKDMMVYLNRSAMYKIYGMPDPDFTFSIMSALEPGDSLTGSISRVSGENAGRYRFFLGSLTAGPNYNLILVVPVSSTFEAIDYFEILPATVVVAPDNGQTKVYGETDPVLTYTVSPALPNGDALTGSLSRAAGENAGTYAIESGTLSAGPNYNLVISAVDFTITPKPITVSAELAWKTYGEADPVFTYTLSAALIAGDTMTGELSRWNGQDAGSYPITQGTLSAGTNYMIQFVGSNFTITRRTIGLTIDSLQKSWGDPDPELTYVVQGNLAYDDAFTGSLSRVAGESTGTYAITIGTLALSNNYFIVNPNNNPVLTISPRPVTVTVTPGQGKVYTGVVSSVGASLPSGSSVTSSGTPTVPTAAEPAILYTVSPELLPGDAMTGQLIRAAGEDAGTYPIGLGTLSAGSNYTITFVAGDYTIVPADRYIVADANQSKVYGETDPVLTYTVSPALPNGNALTGNLSRAAGENAGTYAIESGTLSAGPNYNLVISAVDFTITPKPITVSADFLIKEYGAADPELTYTVSPALVNGDQLSGQLYRTEGEGLVFYLITQGTLTAGANYAITYVENYLQIVKRILKVQPDAGQSKIYGDADPVLTYQVEGQLINNDTFTGSLARATGESTGTYAIGLGSLKVNDYYDVVLFQSGTNFTINPKPITVTADAGQHKTYGQTDPALTYSLSPALVAGDALTGSLTRTAGEDAGTYPIGLGTVAASSNYSLSFVPAAFTIDRAPQTISFAAIPTKRLETDPDFSLAATASSGLPVTYTSAHNAATAPATVSASGAVVLLTSGQVTITASQAGNQNYLPAVSVSQVLNITSSDASIHNLIVDGNNFDNPDHDLACQLDCDHTGTTVTVSFTTEANATSNVARQLVVNVPTAGFYRQSITVTSQDGTQKETYTITIERRFQFEQIIEQKYNNVLLVNNNPETNGGYRFSQVNWYRNGQLVGTGLYYSAGQSASNQLDPNAAYSAELTTTNGQTLQTCDFNIVLNTAFALTVTPNPVKAGSKIDVVTNYLDDMLSSRSVKITSLSGTTVIQKESAVNTTPITLPSDLAPGTYVVTSIASGVTLSAKIIVQ